MDPSYVVSALEKVLTVCPKGAIIIIESTVSPGTISKFVRPAIRAAGFTIGEDIHLAHAPERIIPGQMLSRMQGPVPMW